MRSDSVRCHTRCEDVPPTTDRVSENLSPLYPQSRFRRLAMTAHDSFADDHAYEKTLRWWDGFTISLSIPAALFVGMGYAIGLIGAWTTLVLLGVVAVLACLQNFVYSEMASMFVDKVGGISMYAHQGWRRRSTLVGPIATYGYWFSWSSSLAIYGLQIGKLVQSEWF